MFSDSVVFLQLFGRSPHCRYGMTRWSGEAAVGAKANTLIPLIVGRVGRLEVRRYAELIDTHEVLAQKIHANSMAPVSLVGS